MSSKVMLRCVRHLERISRCFLLPWGTSVFFCPVEGKSCGSITSNGCLFENYFTSRRGSGDGSSRSSSEIRRRSAGSRNATFGRLVG